MEIMVEAWHAGVEDERNNVVIPPEVLSRAIEDFQKRIEANNEALPGECFPPPDNLRLFMNMPNVSHVVRFAHMEKGTMIAKLKLVGKYRELSELGVRFTGRARVLTQPETGVAERCAILTVDLQYREEDV